MKCNIQEFTKGEFDVLIIGGGINGSAIANTASLNGLKVALIEKGDFASGTSSKSTKIVHGGLRYLEQFEFGLVKEALKERFIQLKNAPHLVKPLPFLIPVYKHDKRPMWMMKLGVFLYSMLSGRYQIHKNIQLSRDDVLKSVPGLEEKDLLGGLIYYDAQMDDARLCLENVLQAKTQGAVVGNYLEAVDLIKENGKAVAVKVEDQFSGEIAEIRAKNIICTVGPWTNKFRYLEKSQNPQKIRTTKGVHIVYQGKFCDYAMFLPVAGSSRIFFVIPWEDHSLIGTTDTDYTGDLDDIQVTQEDINYLLYEMQIRFPHRKISEENIITTFAGLRPLVMKEGSPSDISRSHLIERSFSGIYYVMGGKYTTYRKVAQDALSLIIKQPLKNTEQVYPLFGQGIIDLSIDEISSTYEISKDIVENLINIYGSRYENVLKLVKQNELLKMRICSCSATIKAQVVYAIETELAKKVDDIYGRRLGLVYKSCLTKECRKVIETLLTEYK